MTYSSGQRLRDMAVHERPQERMERLGVGALGDAELLAMLLRSGSVKVDVLSLARQLMQEAGSLYGLLSWTARDFQRMPGIGKVKALQLMTVMEVARRVLQSRPDEPVVLNQPELVFRAMQPVTAGLLVEKFWVLCLNRKARLIRRVEVTSGTATGSLVHPREVFRAAIEASATSVIAVHNHPSGDPQPSAADVEVTRELKKAADIMGIDLLDHIIVGHPTSDPQGLGFYSFHEAGVL